MDWPSIGRDLQPAAVAFATAATVLLALTFFAGPRRCSVRGIVRRLRELPACERGGVQGLSFVITLPLYVMLVLFIIQVGLLMQAVVVVHYAAFATARAASVWLPTAVQSPAYAFERRNVVAGPLTATTPAVVALDASAGANGMQSEASLKLVKTAQAAVMACTAIAPSGDFGFTAGPEAGRLSDSLVALYAGLTPDVQDNPRQANRLRRKIAYAAANTFVRIAWIDHDSLEGPTYNPQDIVLIPSVEDLWSMQNRGPWLNLTRRGIDTHVCAATRAGPVSGTPDRRQCRRRSRSRADYGDHRPQRAPAVRRAAQRVRADLL